MTPNHNLVTKYSIEQTGISFENPCIHSNFHDTGKVNVYYEQRPSWNELKSKQAARLYGELTSPKVMAEKPNEGEK